MASPTAAVEPLRVLILDGEQHAGIRRAQDALGAAVRAVQAIDHLTDAAMRGHIALPGGKVAQISVAQRTLVKLAQELGEGIYRLREHERRCR